MLINLLKLQQKRIVALRRIDRFQARFRNRGCDFFLLVEGEEAVAFDAEDEGWLLDLRERVGDGCVRVGGDAVAGDVMRVEFSSDGNVAVSVEAVYEFAALVAEVGLGGEVG